MYEHVYFFLLLKTYLSLAKRRVSTKWSNLISN